VCLCVVVEGVSGRASVRCACPSSSFARFLLPLPSSHHHPIHPATPKPTATPSSMHVQAQGRGRGHGDGVVRQSKDEGKQHHHMRQAKQGLSFIHPAPLDAACASGQQQHPRSVPSIFQDAQTQTTRQQVNVPRFAGPENVAWCFLYGLE